MEPDIINHCTLYLYAWMMYLLSPKITLTLSSVSRDPGTLFGLVGGFTLFQLFHTRGRIVRHCLKRGDHTDIKSKELFVYYEAIKQELNRRRK